MDLTVGTGGQHYFRLKSIENLDQAFDQMIGESYFSLKTFIIFTPSH